MKVPDHSTGSFLTHQSLFVMRCHYPKENNQETIDEIVRALKYTGVLEEKNPDRETTGT